MVERTQFGKYTVVAKIGQGAMGDVYKAHDPVLDRHVALKTIVSSLESSPDARLRFHREAQSIARLNHPNVVTVHDFGEEEGEVYMAMEFLEGRDLRELIAEKQLGSLDEKLGLMQQVCEAVGYAHSRSVVHRDLKPANIQVLDNGQVKVMDFGLARIGAASGMTQTGTVLGTPHYMSPEQVKGEKADPRSDVFALGAILYELLTGHQPFEAESMHAVLFRILEGQPEPVQRWFPAVPDPVVALSAKALTKDASQRFTDGTAMARAVLAVRTELSGELSKGAGTLATLLAREDDSVAQDATRAIPSSHGNLALEALVDSAASPAAADVPRGEPTLSGKAPTRPGVGGGRPGASGRAGTPVWMLGVAAAAVVVVAGGLIGWGMFRPVGPASSAEVPSEAVVGASDLELQLLAAERELAQQSLQDREYQDALDHAERALGVKADDAEALRVRDSARQALDSASAVAAAARAAVDLGDHTTAAHRLEELLEIQPDHPAVAGLTTELNASFQTQAEQARGAAGRAETEARRAGAPDEAIAHARSLSGEGATAFGRGEYAAATERFLSSRDAFARARRAASAAADQAAARQAAVEEAAAERVAVEQAAADRAATRKAAADRAVAERAAADAARPAAERAAAERAAAERAAAFSATSTVAPVTPPVPAGPSDEDLIRTLVADYGRAIETKDLGLFRRVKPNLSGDEQKRLQQAFAAETRQDVNISILDLSVSGGTAHVRLARRDTIDGRAIDPFEQVLTLRRGDAGWTVESIGR